MVDLLTFKQTDLFGQPAPNQRRVVQRRVKPCRGARQTAADAIQAMQPGECCVYYCGDLANDRLRSAEVAGIADAYLEAADDDRVLLSQRRIGPSLYEYRAVRR
jgi:hypothetical protein